MAEKKSNDSIGKTLLVVLVLCLVCSIVVAGSAVGLKSRQQAQRALDKQRNILAVSGLMHPGMDADAVADTFAARITPRLVNLATGELLEKDPGKFNQAQALKDPQQSMALDASQDPAGIKRRSNLAEIYLVRDAQQKIEQVVLPIYGNGLWSMMYAFVALGRRWPHGKRHYLLRSGRNAGAGRRGGKPELAPAVCRQAGAG
ncbi:Na(+)-translocating NADH-quinone reductase subunit C [Klebsiella pneumoniae]|nr:Na(+)-translocating NADH-quinone reductase subunit C [Klebsiella pneumoniae]